MRIDTGLIKGISITEQLKKQEQIFSEYERTYLLDTIRTISKGLEKRRYTLRSLPETLLLGYFEIEKLLNSYNLSLTYAEDSKPSSIYTEKEHGIPIEIPKKRIIRDLIEQGFNILYSGLASKSSEHPLHIKVIFSKEDIDKFLELTIYQSGVLFPIEPFLYPLNVVFEKLTKKGKDALEQRKEFLARLTIPSLKEEMKDNIVTYKTGEKYEKVVQVSEYEAKILDYLGECKGEKLKLGNFTVKDKEVINIRLYYSDLIEFPEIILNFEHLEKLDLSHNEIVSIPDKISTLKNLRKIDLSYNKIKSLPHSIGSLQYLSNISLSNNELQNLPDSIRKLTSLRKFELANNQFEEIPNAIYSLENLEKLDLWENLIIKVPEEIVNLKALKNLEFGSQTMTNIPYSIGLLTTLEQLIILCDNSSNLPDNLDNFKNLNRLELYVDTLSSFPESFGKLNKLETLKLDSSKGSDLPIQLLELKSLERIYFLGDISKVITHGFKNSKLNEEILNKLAQKGVNLYIP